MKIMRNLLLMGMAMTFCCSIGCAQVIYSNSFSGGAVNIDGTSPDVANTYAGGSSSALWNNTGDDNLTNFLANGTLGAFGNGNCTLLNFTPQAGYVYAMTASVVLPSDMNGQWIAMGFAGSNPATTNSSHARFVDTGVNGYSWMLARTGGADAAHQADQFFAGPRGTTETDSGDLVSSAGTYTLKLVLDTIGPNWTTSAYVNGVQMGQTLTYSSNPTIVAAGLGQSGLGTYAGGIQWNYWKLSLSSLPIIAGQPVSATAKMGTAYTNTVVVHGGAAPLFYQWYFNGAPISGATNLSLIINPALTNDTSTNYYFVVRNNYGAVTSAVVSLVVNDDPSAISYWAAPGALGSGDGSSAANAASYQDSDFWSEVQNQLNSTYVTVNFVDGNYNAGTLNFNDMGNPLHRLTLQAVSPNGPVFSTTGNTLVSILGSQNIKFDGLVLTGPVQYWAVNCQPDYLNPCRNLEFSNCQFVNLTNAYYGAIGLLNGVRDILVDNCTFSNLTDNNGNHQHMIYASHNIVDVVVTNCLFQDCLADYIRFRDNAEYCAVENCQFVSTMSASAWPFISAELYNDTNSDAAGDEFFGNHFQISSNSFTYNISGGPGPYSALHFSDTGYSPYGYHCDLTPSEASQLAGGATGFQQSFLQTNMGIQASSIKMFGNTYNSRVAYHMDYTYNQGNAPGNGWTGTIKLDNAPDSSGALLALPPVIRNGNFDRQGLLLTPQTSSTPNQCLFQTWFCNPKYATILRHPGFEGTTNALLFDKTQNQYVYQWIAPPSPKWTMDCQFAIGMGFTGSGTKFKMDLFHNDITGGKISVGVDNLGRFGIYNGGSFTVLPELGTVSFSVDNNGNGNYTDSGDTLNVYRLRIVGNYAASTPYVDIYTSDANNPVLNHQSIKLTDWVNGAPVSGQSAPETIACYGYTAPVMLDQVAIAPGLAGQPPVISSISSGGGNLIISGTNGFPGDTFYLLSSTNLALGNWTVEATNTFDANGAFSVTNTVTSGTPQMFYHLQVQ